MLRCPTLPPNVAALASMRLALKLLITGARINGEGTIEAPGLAKLSDGLLFDVQTMIDAVGAGDRPAGEAAARRFAALEAGLSFGAERVL